MIVLFLYSHPFPPWRGECGSQVGAAILRRELLVATNLSPYQFESKISKRVVRYKFALVDISMNWTFRMLPTPHFLPPITLRLHSWTSSTHVQSSCEGAVTYQSLFLFSGVIYFFFWFRSMRTTWWVISHLFTRAGRLNTYLSPSPFRIFVWWAQWGPARYISDRVSQNTWTLSSFSRDYIDDS